MDNNKARELAAALREHNAWRRREGKYDGEPSVEPMPHTPKQLGEIIDQAATALEAYAQEAAKWGGELVEALTRLVKASETRENWKAQGITHDDAEKECWDAMKQGQRALARAKKMGVE